MYEHQEHDRVWIPAIGTEKEVYRYQALDVIVHEVQRGLLRRLPVAGHSLADAGPADSSAGLSDSAWMRNSHPVVPIRICENRGHRSESLQSRSTIPQRGHCRIERDRPRFRRQFGQRQFARPSASVTAARTNTHARKRLRGMSNSDG